MYLVNVPAKFGRSFTRFCDNSDWSFGVGVANSNLGEEQTVGWYRSKKRW